MENGQMTDPDINNPPTFDTVWASLQETARRQDETGRQIKESQENFDRRMKESQENFDRRMKESQENFDRRMKEHDKRFGDFSNRFGEIAEYMVAPNLQDKFYELGLDFQEVSKSYKVQDHKNKIYFEIDIFLQNGETAMLVEVKTKLTVSDVNEHISRIEKMRSYANIRGDKRYFLGAVAGVIVPLNVKEYVLSTGLYLIEPSGETFNITAPYDKPKEW